MSGTRPVHDSTPLRSTPLDWVVTGVTILIVGGILLRRAMGTGLLCDELLFVHAIDLGIPQSLFAPGSSHPPLMRLVVGALVPTSAPDGMLRLPSIGFSLGTIVVWQRILLRVHGPVVRNLLLPAIAFNGVFLKQGFQCLPYPALVFFASLHCLSWLRLVERPSRGNFVLHVASGVVLPWTHFYGVNLLVADQFVWFALWMRSRFDLRTWVRTSFVVASLTVPVLPILLYYKWIESGYTILAVENYPTYFAAASTLLFSMVSFPIVETTLPLYLLMYAVVGWFVWTQLARRPDSDRADAVGLVLVGVFLAGFPATQLHGLLAEKAIWPRYMLLGSWIHLPLIAYLLARWAPASVPRVFAGACCLLAVLAIGRESRPFPVASDYSDVVGYVDAHRGVDDAFLVQSMDCWEGPNHFDLLWLERYLPGTLEPVSDAPLTRPEIPACRLSLDHVNGDRLWVYSHLFDADWHAFRHLEGWTIREVRDFGGPYPLVLYVRDEGMNRETATRPTRDEVRL